MTEAIPATPSLLGLPADRFPSYRPNQWKALSEVIEATASFRWIIFDGPTGCGKSLVNAAICRTLQIDNPDYRTMYLTGTRMLQDQLMYDFAQTGLYCIKGASNYPCYVEHDCSIGRAARTCLGGPSCPFVAAKSTARSGDSTTTNYAFWGLAGDQLGAYDVLICDEAHDLHGWLTRVSSVEFSAEEVYMATGLDLPAGASWLSCLETYRQISRTRWLQARRHNDEIALQRIEKVGFALATVADSETEWIVTKGDDSIICTPVDPKEFAEARIWRGAKHIILSSATFLEGAHRPLGILDDQITRVSIPSDFPAARRRIMFLDKEPKIRVDSKTSLADMHTLAQRIDAIVGARPGVKGIVATPSYKLASEIINLTGLPNRLTTHKPYATREAVATFKRSSHDDILVSPAVTTGYDFPDDECRLIIIPSIPFVHRGDPLTKARCKIDSNYANLLTALTMIQIPGRGMRKRTDWVEVFILDAHWLWWSKRITWLSWYAESLEKITEIPPPPNFN